MHVCLFTIPKPTQTDRHTPRPTTARRLHAPGHGRPGNTSRPLAPLRRSTGPHHTAYTKAVEREGCQSGRESRRPTVGDTHPPHPNPRSHRVNPADHNLGPPYFGLLDVHTFIPAPRWRILALCLKWAPSMSLGTPSIYTTLPTNTRGASSKPQTNPSSLSPSADRTLESR